MLLIIFCNYAHDELSRRRKQWTRVEVQILHSRLQITLKHGSRDMFAEHPAYLQTRLLGRMLVPTLPHSRWNNSGVRGVCVSGVYLLQPRLDDGDRDAPTVLLHVIVASLLIEVSPQSCHVALCISQHSTKCVAKVVIQPNDLRACWP